MVKIIKNEAIILRKTKFRDSSLILQIYSKDYGKISVILKGARSSKSKIGSKIDLINHVEVVIYNKEEKELQLVTQVNLIDHFSDIKEDLEKIKYASAVCELILKLIPENEPNERIFLGTARILKLINDSLKPAFVYFTQYLIFFIKQIGYEISFEACSNCGEKIDKVSGNAFSYSNGIICEKCEQDKKITFPLSEELFNLMQCLTTKKDMKSINLKIYRKIIFVLEKFLIYHVPDFNGIKSLKIL
jgi:DNA repair protein RecO (recombination protein O)